MSLVATFEAPPAPDLQLGPVFIDFPNTAPTPRITALTTEWAGFRLDAATTAASSLPLLREQLAAYRNDGVWPPGVTSQQGAMLWHSRAARRERDIATAAGRLGL